MKIYFNEDSATVFNLNTYRLDFLGLENGNPYAIMDFDEFNTVVRDTHSAYSTSTGLFTAPVAGIYLFTFNYYTNDDTAVGSKRPTIRISGGDSQATVQMSSNRPGSMSTVARMPQGATACVTPYSSSWTMDFYASGLHNHFTGTLLSYI